MEENKKSKKSKVKIVIVLICIIAIVLIGLQIYAATNGYGDVFSMVNNWINPKVEKEENKELNENSINTTTKENQLEPDNYAKMVEIDDAYDKFIEKMSKSKALKSTRIDIDNDGVHELIVLRGDFEAEKEISFYTYKNDEVKDLGKLGFGHSLLYKMNNKDYLLQVYGQMGSEEVSKIFIKNGKIQKEKLSERTIKPEEGYTKGDVLLKELFEEIQLEPDNYAEEVMEYEKNTKGYIGTWQVKKALNINEEVSLQEIYGTSIKYGVGNLSLNLDNTFKDQIAPVYESEESREGTYKVNDNSITLMYKNGAERYITYNPNDNSIKYNVFDDYSLIMEKK